MSNEVMMSEAEKQEHTTKALPHYRAMEAADAKSQHMKHLLSLSVKASDGDGEDLPHIAWLSVEWRKTRDESREHSKRCSAELPEDQDARVEMWGLVARAARNG